MPSHQRKNLGFRAKKAQEASYDLLELLIRRENVGLDTPVAQGGLTPEEIAALKVLQVGRVDKVFGNGWCDVLCQDNRTRRSRIRGLLRSARKGGHQVEIGSTVVVALETPVDTLGESDDEGYIAPNKGGGSKMAAGGGFKDAASYIVGVFASKDLSALKKTRINKAVFNQINAGTGEVHDVSDDIFDRSGETPVHISRRQRKLLEEKAGAEGVEEEIATESL